MSDKKLGFGLMRLPLTDGDYWGSVDKEETRKMVDLFMEKGFNYFDTAILYHDHTSEPLVKELISDRYDRESFVLATKLHPDYFKTIEDCEKVFAEQLEKTGAGYFDYYLLHGISADSYQKHESVGTFDFIREKKEQGLIKNIGFSYHDDAKLLDKVLEAHTETDVVQLQINYLDWENEWVQSRECYETAVKYGKPVIVMEPVKGGTLAKVPSDVMKVFKEADPDASAASWAMRFAASLPNVIMVLSGMSSLEQMKDNISCMEYFVPLTEAENEMLLKAADEMRNMKQIHCTGCNYCMRGCPANIPIPKFISLYNDDMMEVEGKWTPNKDIYARLSKKFGKASYCLECGNCEASCPQHLKIIDILKDIANYMEG